MNTDECRVPQWVWQVYSSLTVLIVIKGWLMSWLMFVSLLKNIAECFMKAIKGLSFSSTNEHQPYVNTQHFSLQRRRRLLEMLWGFRSFFLLFAFALVSHSCHVVQVFVWMETGVTLPLWLGAEEIECEHWVPLCRPPHPPTPSPDGNKEATRASKCKHFN